MLQIRLLGQFDVRLDGKRIMIPSRAGQSVLAYLVLTAGTSHRREKLAGIFWPDTTDENARKNLRQELWRIRKAISVGQPTERDYLLADEFTLAFNREAEYWLDVFQMERPDLDLQSLIANLSLYQGELLPGFYDEWIALERERVQAIFEARMEQLLEQLITAERWIAVQEWGERWLTLSNEREPAYRALMLASGVRGDVAKVASLYQRCTDELMEQLGVEPSAETCALYDRLLKGGQVPPRTAAQPSGTITFLFSDIEESTHLLEKMGDQYADALAEHHEILRAAIQKWNGREVDTQGDAFFVTFTRALDAVQCAAEAQRALAAHAWHQGEHLRVRMGLHTGEPLIASTGYVGMDVHRAARIGDAGHGEQILLSQTTRELVIHDLPEGMAIRDLGEYRLKDMKYPASIFQLVVNGLPAEFAPIRTKFSGAEAPTPGEAPFKGLQFFDVEDSDLFFGRETLTAKLLNRLHEEKFLSVIIGASGSGKSSLVRAGLVPAIKQGHAFIKGTKPRKGRENWQIHIMTPTAHPLEALAIELTRDSESVTAAGTLVDDLSKDPRSLHFFFSRRTQTSDSSHILLVIDQFEELFTLCRDEFEREAFIDNLLSALTPTPLPAGEGRRGEGNITLIITLRADFYAHLAQYPELRDMVAQQQEYIGPMTTEELRSAIEEPARRGRWEFEPGLVDLILRDVGDEPGALPLLSHALLETWKRRAGHMLTLKGYADAGGVHGAIAHTAENVYQNLSRGEQTIMRNILLRLTEFGEGTEDTRRRSSFDELISHAEEAHQVRSVLNRLAEARLVTLSEDSAEVAHEALIREWPQLREWLSQDREGILLHRHLTEASHEWELLERDADALYRGARLAQANEWTALNPDTLNAQERTFLDASNMQAKREEQEREEQRQRELAAAKELADTQRQSASRLRLRNRVILTVGIIALVLAVLASAFGLRSNENATQAQTNLSIAQANAATAEAERQRADQNLATAQADFRRAEAQRLAAEANVLLQQGGSSELIALLSLRSLNLQYSPQGDAALAGAALLAYPRQIFTGHNKGICSSIYSPDGRYALTSSDDKTARLWDVQTGQEVRQFVHPDLVCSLAFSPDSQYLLTGGDDGMVRLWDVQTGAKLRLFGGDIHLGRARVAFSPDGRHILTGSTEGFVRLWDVQTGAVLRQFGDYNNRVRSVAFSPDGQYAIATGDGIIRLWDVSTGAELRRFVHTSSLSRGVFSPDGKLILAGGYDGVVLLWDVATGREVHVFRGHTGFAIPVDFSPDGRYVLSGGDDLTIRLWDAQTGEEVKRFIGHTSLVRGVSFSPDGRYIFTSSYDETARLWEVESKPELPVFTGHTSDVYSVAFSPDGRSLLTGSLDGTARLWDVQTGHTLHVFTDTGQVYYGGAAFSPDGQYVLTGDRVTGIASLWEVQSGKKVREFVGHTQGLYAVAFSPDGHYAVTGGIDRTVRLWEVATGQEIRQFIGHTGQVLRVRFSPDGRMILTSSQDGAARLWEVATGQELRIYRHTSFVIDGAFSLDGRYLVTASLDRTARLWEVATGQEIRQFLGHFEGVLSAVFSPDAQYIATASVDRTARLWDVDTGQELRRFAGHTALVENLAFSPDGRYLVTVSDDRTARTWHVDIQDTIRYLCSILLRDLSDDERQQYNITDTTPTCPKP